MSILINWEKSHVPVSLVLYLKNLMFRVNGVLAYYIVVYPFKYYNSTI